MRNRYLPWIALALVYVLWGSTYAAIRVAVATIPPYLMAGTRYVIAGLLLLALQWALAKEKPAAPTWPQLRRIAVTGILLLTVGNGLLCSAETRVESGTAALLGASVPIWMILFDSLRERKAPGWSAIAGIVLGSAGIALLVGKSSGGSSVLFAALIVLASIAWALGSIYARGEEHHPLSAPLEMTIGGFLMVLVGAATGEFARLHPSAVTAQSLWGMLWLITAGAMVGYSAYTYAVRTLPTATVATYAYVNPVVAVLLGALVLRESVTWNVAAGGAAILASVALILLSGRRKGPVAAELAQEAVV